MGGQARGGQNMTDQTHRLVALELGGREVDAEARGVIAARPRGRLARSTWPDAAAMALSSVLTACHRACQVCSDGEPLRSMSSWSTCL